MPSSFGGELPYEGKIIKYIYRLPIQLILIGLQARVKYADPADGCLSIDPPMQNNTFLKWVALVSRNNCTFEAKIRNAQNANYDAIIVHNVGSDYTEEMSVQNSTGIEIPSIFIGEHDGLYIRRKFQSSNMYYIVITPDAPFNINTHLLLPFAIVVAICFLVMIIFMVS